MKCLRYLLFYLLLLLSISSCCAKKITVANRVQHNTIDTIVKINFDLIPVVKSGLIKDTVKAENRTAIAVTYYDMKLQKIVLKLQSKPFEVPVKLNQTIETKVKEVEKKEPVKFYLITGLLAIILLIIYKLVR